jgi:hypothetical protein
MKRILTLAVVVAGVVIAGCQGPVDKLLADQALREQLWLKVTGSPELSGQVVDRLLGADSTRTVLLGRMMANAEARQAMLTMVAKDRTLMDGALNFAVQDSSMRDHVKTLVKGMEMGGGR